MNKLECMELRIVHMVHMVQMVHTHNQTIGVLNNVCVLASLVVVIRQVF